MQKVQPASAPRIEPVVQKKLEEGVQTYVDRAAYYRERGDLAMAEENLRMALRIEPGHREAALELADVLEERGRTDEAITLLKASSGADSHIRHALAQLLVRSGRLAESEEVFMQMAQANMDDPLIHYNLGLVRFQLDRLPAAESSYRRALELHPQFADAMYNLALVHIRRKEYPEAVLELERALRIQEDADYLVNYGVVLRELKRYPAAVSAFQRALALDPNNILSMNNLGITHYLRGDMTEAASAFGSVLRLDPTDPTAREHLTKISSKPAPPAPATAESMPRPADMPMPAGKMDMAFAARDTAAMKAAMPMPKPKDDMQALRDENMQLRGLLAELQDMVSKLSHEVAMDAFSKKATQPRVETPTGSQVVTQVDVQGGLVPPPVASGSMMMPALPAVPQMPVAQGETDKRINALENALMQTRDDIKQIRDALLGASPDDRRVHAAHETIHRLQNTVNSLEGDRDRLRGEMRLIGRAGEQASSAPDAPRQVELNGAALADLLRVPAMTEPMAHNILWYRNNIARFKTVLDIKNVPGMDNAKYAQFVDYIRVDPAP